MVYLLDTNVLSELVKPNPDERVERWMRSQSPLDLCISVLTLGEIERGITLLAPGSRRTQLLQWAHAELPRQFNGRLLGIDANIASAWGQLSAGGSISGRPLPVVDGLLVATAREHRLTFVTRNVSDCAGRGVAVYDPWSDALHA